MIIVFYGVFFSFKKNRVNIKISKTVLLTYCILILILFEWFLNHPALRYGGYCIIALMIFIPYSFYLHKINITSKKYNKIALILVLISIFTFETRNYFRIINEVNLYDYKPLSETFYTIDEKYFSIQKIIDDFKNNNE